MSSPNSTHLPLPPPHPPPKPFQTLPPTHPTTLQAPITGTIPNPPPTRPPPVLPPSSSSRPLLHGAVEKQRRSGKYTHPFGGMRQFAEDRAGRSGWDIHCLSFDNLDQRKTERSKLADQISENYKEEFVKVNRAQGKGRPKANNISAAKKTVRMIAERILLSLEARATQNVFKEALENRKKSEKELTRLRHIHNCGRENPKLSYDEIRSIARARLSSMGHDDTGSETTGGQQGVTISDSLESDGDADLAEIEMMKQAIVEMRAEEVSKGFTPMLLSDRWVNKVTRACRRLVQQSYSRQFVPRTKVYGCKHFTRKNRILMVCCGTFPVCRMCHIQDPSRIHDVRIEPVQTMLCMMCGEVQPKTQYCRKCKVCFGSYYCDVCGITDDTPGYDLRHCDKCNVCMPGLTFHCDRCQSCVPATPEHDAVCTGRNRPTNDREQNPDIEQQVVNNINEPGPSIDQSIDALTSEARSNQLFSGL